MSEATTQNTVDMKQVVKAVLDSIDREREREIISRRFGLYDRKETLEQIGELLGITRERVRQLEKSIVAKLSESAPKDVPQLKVAEKEIVKQLHENGRVATVKNLAIALGMDGSDRDQAHISLIATLADGLSLLGNNDHYHQSVGIAEHHDERQMKQHVDEIVQTVKEHGEPTTIDTLHEKLSHGHPSHVAALASVSKNLSNLKELWGLNKWPTVNPKNIRDKIYVILQDNKEPMHFGSIADSIKSSDFKRKNVTTQAIHNELIKDKRFVLIGRGIYALKEWGYKKGTVADIITEILQKSEEPLHRDEIVKRVLEHRQVKETTILLNLQGKPQFKRVAKATYALDAA